MSPPVVSHRLLCTPKLRRSERPTKAEASGEGGSMYMELEKQGITVGLTRRQIDRMQETPHARFLGGQHSSTNLRAVKGDAPRLLKTSQSVCA